MAFCTGCGADVTGRNFCVQCGKMVGGSPAAGASTTPPQAVPQPPRPTGPPSYPPGPPQQAYSAPPPGQMMPAKKTSPVVWIIVGVVGFFVLIGLVISAGAAFFVHKVKQNPALAMAKLITAANPNVEVIGSDSGNNTVTFRDKQTGETVTVNFDDLKKGRIDFRNGKGEHATINAQTQGQNGTLEINGPNGSMKFGTGSAAQIPSWVPSYPGSNPEGTFSMQGSDGGSGSFSFTTKDDAKQVLNFYDNALKQAGFKITGNMTTDTGTGPGGMVTAQDEGSKRSVMATVSTENGATKVGVIYGTKK